MEIEELKKDADALGVKYHPAIGAEKLQAKIDDFNNVKPVEATKEPEYKPYKNTSDVNLFTEDGRCAPNRIVKLTKDEAAQYKGLELCEK